MTNVGNLDHRWSSGTIVIFLKTPVANTTPDIAEWGKVSSNEPQIDLLEKTL